MSPDKKFITIKPIDTEFKPKEEKQGENSLTPGIHKIISGKLEENFIDALSNGEIEQLYKHIEIHGDPLEGKMLTPEILKDAGLLPRYQIETKHGVMWFSSSGYRMENNRIATVAYVQKNNKLIPRTYYRSNSQGVWRYLPSANSPEGKYDKGYREESINLPVNIQIALAKLMGKEGQILDINNPGLIFRGTARRWDRSVLEGTFYGEIESEPKKLGNFKAEEEGEKVAPETIDLPEDLQPDLSEGKTLARWIQDSEIYGDINMEAVPSKDKTLIYIFCRDKLNRVWIGSVEDDSKVLSTGLKQTWIDLGDFGTPAYEYLSQAGKYVNFNIKSGNYVDVFENYLSKIPTIREYCKSRGIPLPQIK